MPTFIDAIETFVICMTIIGPIVAFFPNPGE